MPFCSQCGTQFQGNFCPACGTKAETSGASSGLPPQMPGGPEHDSSTLDDHVASALAYLLWPLSGVLFLVLEPYSSNRNVRFHAYQSVFSFGAFFIGFAFLQILSGIPILGFVFLILTSVYMFVWFCVVLIMAYKAYMKERFVLPIIGALAEKQA